MHIPADLERGTRDVHLVKEQVHYDDDTVEPRLNTIVNFQRDLYITKPAFRNHKQKKDWESMDKLDKYTCTQSEMEGLISKKLGFFSKRDMRQLKSSPYLYGVDVDSTSIIKKKYADEFAKTGLNPTPNTVAAFDVETDVVNYEDEKERPIIIASITMKHRVYCAVLKSYVQSMASPEIEVNKAIEMYLGETIRKRGITDLVVEYVDTSYDIIKRCFDRAHEWMPDVVSIHGLNHEMERMSEEAKRSRIDLKDILCAPTVPRDRRRMKWNPGKEQKITASGKFTPVKFHNRWPIVDVLASFRMLCSMCTYRHIRIANQEESSYSLDAILAKETKGQVSKLKIKEAERYTGIDWHFYMQIHHKAAYIAYNIFDDIGLEILDETTKDFARGLPINLDYSDSSLFGSQPARTVVSEHFYVLEKGDVMGCVAKEMKIDLDDKIYPLRGWIVALRAHLIADNGAKCVLELPKLATNCRLHVAD